MRAGLCSRAEAAAPMAARSARDPLAIRLRHRSERRESDYIQRWRAAHGDGQLAGAARPHRQMWRRHSAGARRAGGALLRGANGASRRMGGRAGEAGAEGRAHGRGRVTRAGGASRPICPASGHIGQIWSESSGRRVEHNLAVLRLAASVLCGGSRFGSWPGRAIFRATSRQPSWECIDPRRPPA